MTEHDGLADRFEADRAHLRAVAYRMLGSLSEADDAVQEAWLRLNGTDAARVQNLSGWLTTGGARISLGPRPRRGRARRAAARGGGRGAPRGRPGRRVPRGARRRGGRGPGSRSSAPA